MLENKWPSKYCIEKGQMIFLCTDMRCPNIIFTCNSQNNAGYDFIYEKHYLLLCVSACTHMRMCIEMPRESSGWIHNKLLIGLPSGDRKGIENWGKDALPLFAIHSSM